MVCTHVFSACHYKKVFVSLLHKLYEIHLVIETAVWAGHLTFKWVCHNDGSTGAHAIKKIAQHLSVCVTEIVCHFAKLSQRNVSGRKMERHVILK